MLTFLRIETVVQEILRGSNSGLTLTEIKSAVDCNGKKITEDKIKAALDTLQKQNTIRQDGNLYVLS